MTTLCLNEILINILKLTEVILTLCFIIYLIFTYIFKLLNLNYILKLVLYNIYILSKKDRQKLFFLFLLLH